MRNPILMPLYGLSVLTQATRKALGSRITKCRSWYLQSYTRPRIGTGSSSASTPPPTNPTHRTGISGTIGPAGEPVRDRELTFNITTTPYYSYGNTSEELRARYSAAEAQRRIMERAFDDMHRHINGLEKGEQIEHKAIKRIQQIEHPDELTCQTHVGWCTRHYRHAYAYMIAGDIYQIYCQGDRNNRPSYQLWLCHKEPVYVLQHRLKDAGRMRSFRESKQGEQVKYLIGDRAHANILVEDLYTKPFRPTVEGFPRYKFSPGERGSYELRAYATTELRMRLDVKFNFAQYTDDAVKELLHNAY